MSKEEHKLPYNVGDKIGVRFHNKNDYIYDVGMITAVKVYPKDLSLCEYKVEPLFPNMTTNNFDKTFFQCQLLSFDETLDKMVKGICLIIK